MSATEGIFMLVIANAYFLFAPLFNQKVKGDA